MGCNQAEILRLIELIEYEVWEKEPKPKNLDAARLRWAKIAGAIRELSIEELKIKLGI